jgi:hypothetical protein
MHSKLKQITAQLDKLTDKERFLLYLSAVGRGDEKAAGDVCQTARRAEYRMTAYPFQGMVDGLPVVMVSVIADVCAGGFLLYHRLATVLYRDSRAANDDPDAPLDIDRLLAMSDLTLAPWRALRRFLIDDIGLPEQEIEKHIPNLATVQAVVSTAEFARQLYLDSWLGFLAAELDDAESEKKLSQRRQEAAGQLEDLTLSALADIRQLWQKYTGSDNDH